MEATPSPESLVQPSPSLPYKVSLPRSLALASPDELAGLLPASALRSLLESHYLSVARRVLRIWAELEGRPSAARRDALRKRLWALWLSLPGQRPPARIRRAPRIALEGDSSSSSSSSPAAAASFSSLLSTAKSLLPES